MTLQPYQIKNVLEWHKDAVNRQRELEQEHPELFNLSDSQVKIEFGSRTKYLCLKDVFYLFQISRASGLAVLRESKLPIFLLHGDLTSGLSMRERDLYTFMVAAKKKPRELPPSEYSKMIIYQ